jgi:hypothetical protein
VTNLVLRLAADGLGGAAAARAGRNAVGGYSHQSWRRKRSNSLDATRFEPMTKVPAAEALDAGRRPEDAAAFVELVEHPTNECLTDAIYEIFAADARSVMIADGAREESVGVDAIHDAWAKTCTAFKACRFRLEKRLVAATDDTIVNEWRGGPHGRHDGCGIEVWRFGHQSRSLISGSTTTSRSGPRCTVYKPCG